jgi:hypothetical protein
MVWTTLPSEASRFTGVMSRAAASPLPASPPRRLPVAPLAGRVLLLPPLHGPAHHFVDGDVILLVAD